MDDLMERICSYLDDEKARLEAEIAAKGKKYASCLETLRSLSLPLFFWWLLGSSVKKFLSWRIRKIKLEIADLQQEISQYREALSKAGQAGYILKMDLLERLAARRLFMSTGQGGDISWEFIGDPVLSDIIGLKKALRERVIVKSEPCPE